MERCLVERAGDASIDMSVLLCSVPYQAASTVPLALRFPLVGIVVIVGVAFAVVHQSKWLVALEAMQIHVLC